MYNQSTGRALELSGVPQRPLAANARVLWTPHFNARARKLQVILSNITPDDFGKAITSTATAATATTAAAAATSSRPSTAAGSRSSVAAGQAALVSCNR